MTIGLKWVKSCDCYNQDFWPVSLLYYLLVLHMQIGCGSDAPITALSQISVANKKDERVEIGTRLQIVIIYLKL